MSVSITREHVLDCIRNFAIKSAKISLIRDYCLENGKDPEKTELFLNNISDIPLDIVSELARYIIEIKSPQFHLTSVINRQNRVIHIY